MNNLRHALGSTGGGLLAGLALTGLAAFTTAWLGGAEALSAYVLIWSIIQFAATLGRLATERLVVPELTRGDFDPRDVASTVVALSTAGGLIAGGLAALGISNVPALRPGAWSLGLAAGIVVAVAAESCRPVLAEILRSQHRFGAAVVHANISRPAAYIVALTAWNAASPSVSVEAIVLAITAASAVATSASFVLVAISRQFGRTQIIAWLRRHVSSHVAVVTAAVAASVLNVFDVWVIGSFAQQPEVAGYRLAVTAVSIFGVGAAAISSSTQPFLAIRSPTGGVSIDPVALERARRASYLVSVTAAAGLALLVLAAALGTGWLAQRGYENVTASVVYLGLGQLAAVCAGPSGQLLALDSGYRAIAAIAVPVAAATIALQLLVARLVPSVASLAIVSGSSLVVLHVVSNVACRRRTGYFTFASRGTH